MQCDCFAIFAIHVSQMVREKTTNNANTGPILISYGQEHSCKYNKMVNVFFILMSSY